MYTLTCIHCNIHNYIRNQEIRVAMLCFFNVFFGCKNFIHIQKKLNKKDNENNIKQNKQRKLCTANNYIQ